MRKMVECWKLFLKCKKAVVFAIICFIAEVAYSVIDAKLLLWISACIDNYADPIPYIRLLIIGSVSECALRFIGAYYTKSYMNVAFTELNNMYADKILDADYGMFIKHSCSKIVTIGESVWKLVKTIHLMISMVVWLIKIIVTFAAIAMIDTDFVGPVLVIYIISIPIMRHVFAKLEAISGSISGTKLSKNKEIDNIINGFAEVRSFNTQEYHKNSIHDKNKTIVALSKNGSMMTAKCDTFIELIVFIPTVVVILQVVKKMAEGVIDAAMGLSVVMYIWRLINPLICIIDGLDSFSDYTMHLDDFLEIVRYQNQKDGELELKEFNNEIKFENVSFAYNDSDTVLQDIDLTIKKGQKIGICGSSGGGKSTLLKLLPRFYNTYSGTISIDGIDTKQLTAASLRSKLSIVHQDNYIFDGTVYENIIYGNMNASEYDIIEACKKASIYEFIQSLPDKFNTNVGPKGLKLSGGQKQRIALARIFLSNADIILLDEATSALDNESENIVQESLDLFDGKTIITVAHRLTTIKDCDKILVIDNHRIVESGSHEELIEKKGEYYKLYNA